MSGTKDPKDLVAQIMGKGGKQARQPEVAEAPASQGAPAPEATSGSDAAAGSGARVGAPAKPGAAPSPAISDEDVADLIEVYFSLEEPAERDVAFDQLAAVESEATTEFFVAMMTNDEDEYMRRAAAAELARRGHPEALASLKEDLAVEADPLAFEHALETLAQIQGEKFVPVVAAMWKDTTRNSLQRRTAMTVFEWLDTPRALTAFVAFVNDIADVKNFADDILDQAMAAFGRHEHAAAVPALQRLQSRMVAHTWEDEEEKAEAIAFVGEGLELLQD